MLNDYLADFVDEIVEKGIYFSPSEAVRAGLQLLEEHEAKVKALQDALIEGKKGHLRRLTQMHSSKNYTLDIASEMSQIHISDRAREDLDSIWRIH